MNDIIKDKQSLLNALVNSFRPRNPVEVNFTDIARKALSKLSGNNVKVELKPQTTDITLQDVKKFNIPKFVPVEEQMPEPPMPEHIRTMNLSNYDYVADKAKEQGLTETGYGSGIWKKPSLMSVIPRRR